jgi:hypothetical protein
MLVDLMTKLRNEEPELWKKIVEFANKQINPSKIITQ